MTMVQVQRSEDHITIPKDVLQEATTEIEGHRSCAVAQVRRTEIEERVLVLIEDVIVGDASRIEPTIVQIAPSKKHELELMAQVIVSKARDEPQHCKACVSLAGALQILLPVLPPGQHGKKGETFMHALLDVFQTEFEAACMDAARRGEESGSSCGAHSVTQRNQHRIRAIVHLAGHLHCHRLLGNGVVSQMVHDLVDNGEAEAANELLWFIGRVANDVEQHRNLGTVLEDVGDSDGASSESVSQRRPSLP